MSRLVRAATALVAVLGLTAAAVPPSLREAVLKQIDLPHSYYYREMYLPQVTSGPSSVAWSPDGKSLVYSMAGSLWRQEIGSEHGERRQDQDRYRDDTRPAGRHEDRETRRARRYDGDDRRARLEARGGARRQRRVERRGSARGDRPQAERGKRYGEEDDGHTSTRRSSTAGPSSFSTTTVNPSISTVSPGSGSGAM